GSHNGTYVNGTQVLAADLKDGDQIRAGHTILRIEVQSALASPHATINVPTGDRGAAAAMPQIPGFLLARELGRGAMGATYLGHRVDDQPKYAVKVVTPSFQGSPAQIEDFLGSARFLTRLDHPNIVRLCEVGGYPSGFYFASEFVPGVNAEEILKRDGPLSV